MEVSAPGAKRKHGSIQCQVPYLPRITQNGPLYKSNSLDMQHTRHKKQKTLETLSGETHLSLPHTSSQPNSSKQQQEFISTSAEGAHPDMTAIGLRKPSDILQDALSSAQYSDMRSAILRHQELFLGQLYDLHHTVQLQRHLVSICSHRDAMDTELAKLEAEQNARLNSVSDNTVEQEDGTENLPASTLAQGSGMGQAWQSGQTPGPNTASTPVASSKQPAEPQARSISNQDRPPAASQAPSQTHPNPYQNHKSPGEQPGMEVPQQGLQTGVWPGMFPRGYPMQYGQPGMGMGAFNGWGMPMMGSTFGGGFDNPYGMPFGMMGPHMDPMMAWYALHYGQYAHAMQNQANAASAANARRQAQAQQEGAAAAAANEKAAQEDNQARQNLRWWQDPEKVFGIAANPAIIGNPPPSNPRKLSTKADLQTEVTSKPPQKQGTSTKPTTIRPPKSPSNPTRTSSKPRAGGASAASEPIGSHQKAGSGISAFKKLPTKSPNVRRPPTRAESIGSEVSRSAAERSPADEGESSGVAHAVAKR